MKGVGKRGPAQLQVQAKNLVAEWVKLVETKPAASAQRRYQLAMSLFKSSPEAWLLNLHNMCHQANSTAHAE